MVNRDNFWFGLHCFIKYTMYVFVLVCSSHSRIFTDSETSPLPVKVYAHMWSLSIEGSLACHTYCDTGHPFIMFISEDPWHLHLHLAFGSAAVTTCFNDLGLSRLGFEHPTFRLRGKRSNLLRHRDLFSIQYSIQICPITWYKIPTKLNVSFI